MEHRIEKRIELKAPVSRVWRALTDHREFGQWFQVEIDAPFLAGQPSFGHFTVPGYEHLRWQVVIQRIEPEKLFSFSWHPYAIDRRQDYSAETPTLVEFRLQPTAGGTLLLVSESGFENLPDARRGEAFRMNDSGWSTQLRNIATHVTRNE
jgi:uncharacterized protein YndB with AHSA1/START domain